MAVEVAPGTWSEEFSEGRRFKAAMALFMLWSLTLLLHRLVWGSALIWLVTAAVAAYLFRVIVARPLTGKTAVMESAAELETWPQVSLLVAAKNEVAVIARLVETLCNLDYPGDRYELWIIDDNSSDGTGALLDRLAQRYDRLNVLHRGPDASGGKSGALNLAWPRTTGEILAVFDADAQVPKDLLYRAIPLFQEPRTGAVQVRKAITNHGANFWTRGQHREMALDSYYQEQRIACGGIGELRGNGQLVRRQAIAQCGGWNELTITDDLDLTVQLHLHQWNIGFLSVPHVGEEGVTSGLALWHQRNRWAEGGYQRYLDYWRLIGANRLGWNKSADMLVYWILQYMLPIVTLPDLVLAIATRQPPVFAPLTTLAIASSYWGMACGISRTKQVSLLAGLIQAVQGTVYMTHWIPIMTFATLRMAVRPKRLRWVKTVHEGEAAST